MQGPEAAAYVRILIHTVTDAKSGVALLLSAATLISRLAKSKSSLTMVAQLDMGALNILIREVVGNTDST